MTTQTAEQLKLCPFCGSAPNPPYKTDSSDERCGYNFKVFISCQCGVTISAASAHDKNGWCNDKGEAKKSVIKKWNARTKQAAEIERLRTALKDLHDDSIGFQDRDNWAMKAAREALEAK